MQVEHVRRDQWPIGELDVREERRIRSELSVRGNVDQAGAAALRFQQCAGRGRFAMRRRGQYLRDFVRFLERERQPAAGRMTEDRKSGRVGKECRSRWSTYQ